MRLPVHVIGGTGELACQLRRMVRLDRCVSSDLVLEEMMLEYKSRLCKECLSCGRFEQVKRVDASFEYSALITCSRCDLNLLAVKDERGYWHQPDSLSAFSYEYMTDSFPVKDEISAVTLLDAVSHNFKILEGEQLQAIVDEEMGGPTQDVPTLSTQDPRYGCFA